MFSVLLRPPHDLEEQLVAELWECGTAGIIEEEGGIRAFFDSPIAREPLLERFSAYVPELREEESVDWVRATQDAWPPILVGQRFFLTPPWCNEPTPAGRLRLPINPGMACGTGRHPATQLALEAIERHVRAGDHVVDVGTGSGILATAANLMGARQVIGCDIDLEAIRVARERVRTPLFVGSAAAIRSGWADVVIANIDSATIEQLSSELMRIRKPASKLILTGFPEWDAPESFQARETLEKEDWICLIC